jgi:hypothetical protein
LKTCEYDGDPFEDPRSHPWLAAAETPESRYYDLTVNQARIRTSLEDFLPWNRFAAVESFYALLERLNHSKSALESNDCAFTGPHRHEDPSVPKPFTCCGRVMVLFRALERNTDEGLIAWLKNELHAELSALDADFEWGVIGTTRIPVRYLQLPELGGKQLGSQLMISFWAWGNDVAETMQNLARLIKNLSRALSLISKNAARLS